MAFFRESKEVSSATEDKGMSEKIDTDDDHSIQMREEDGSNSLVSVAEHGINMNVIGTIKEIDKLYKQGVIHYTESIHRYNIEIEKLKGEIELEHQKNSEEQRSIFSIESILSYECKLFEKLHDKLTQKIASVVELRDEYKDSLAEHLYREKLSQKERDLFRLMDEIEEKELSLLNQELEKINLSNIFNKKLKKVEELTATLKELELEKNYFESTELQRLSYFAPEELVLKGESTQIVDTVIMDKEK